jgi:hypothetical protein
MIVIPMIGIPEFCFRDLLLLANASQHIDGHQEEQDAACNAKAIYGDAEDAQNQVSCHRE